MLPKLLQLQGMFREILYCESRCKFETVFDKEIKAKIEEFIPLKMCQKTQRAEDSKENSEFYHFYEEQKILMRD